MKYLKLQNFHVICLNDVESSPNWWDVEEAMNNDRMLNQNKNIPAKWDSKK